MISEDDCTGCGLCVSGCPYGAIYFDDEKGVAGKCSLCASRIDDGLEPSCVQHCISGALQFLTEDELAETIRGINIARNGKVCYVSSKWKISLWCF
jgi:formate dehydrogenase iron-sulfur subunit